MARSSTARLVIRIAGAVAFRYACFVAMVALTLINEQRSFPRLSDRFLEIVPYVPWVDEWNYWIWLAAYLPASVALLVEAPRRCIRFLITGGLLSLVRGVCVLMTGLGPVKEEQVGLNAGVSADAWISDTLEVANPLKVFFEGSAHTHLNQDLFFSGHVSTMLLVLLYCWPYARLRRALLALNVVVVATVFLSHLHYTIDVVGAWAIAFALFVLREGGIRGLGDADPADRWKRLRPTETNLRSEER